MFRAYDARRERLVAVKLFRLDLAPERVRRLVAEFERLIAAELKHPAMAAPLASGITGASAYLAQDYVAAESLDAAVREYGPAPPSDALRVAAQLAGALDFAAVIDINHGALHPRDVLLSTEETRLTGLGVIRSLETIGVDAPLRRPYSAPERIAGRTWDRRADIFSLAALIHELLCGRRVSGTGRQAVEGMGELAGGDLSRLQSVFARALAEDPDDRFETALEFAEALKEAFPGIGTGSQSPETGRSASRRETSEPRSAVVPEPRLPLDDPMIVTERREEANEPVGPAEADLGLRAIDLFTTGARIEAPAAAEPISVPERAGSALWPFMATLVIGLALGFAGGYAVASRERLARGAVSPPAAAAARESTEVAVSEPSRTAPVVETSTPAPAAATSVRREREGGPEDRAPTASTVSPFAGRLLVRSTPAGARVVVDGRDAGRTPIVVRDLQPGEHRVRVQRDGYVSEDRRVTLTPARPARSMSFELARPRAAPGASAATATSGRFSGVLAIESRPGGAKVYLDGRLVGTTPLSIDAVPAGEHAVRLERDGYRRWSSSIRVVAAATNRVTASLER